MTYRQDFTVPAELVGHFKTPGMSTRVVADDTFFYLSANQGGLWKLKLVDLK